MCTAYELGKRGGSFPRHVKARTAKELLGLSGTTLVRPTLPALVMLADGEPTTMHWGFRRSFAAKTKGGKPIWRTIVNSREDKLSGPTWRDAFAERRCMIPASAFFEWVVKDGRNTPLRFTRPGDAWLWIAGIWEEHSEIGMCFSMITTEPNALVKPVHDRMPAILTDEQISPFLAGELNELGPSSVAVKFQEAENFLEPPSSQLELF